MSQSMNELLWKQEQYERALGYDFNEMLTEQKVAYIKEYSLHLEDELHEVLRELPFFKPWKRYPDVDPTFSKAKEEFIDVFHYVLTLALALGLDGDTICDMYREKMEINKIRQTQVTEYKRCVEDAKRD